MNSFRKWKDRWKEQLLKPISLRKRLLVMIVIFWILPIFLVFLFMITTYRNSIIKKTETLMAENVKNFTTMTNHKIEEAITISRKISYDRVIEEAWKNYKADYLTRAFFYKEVTGVLKSKFFNDTRFDMSVFYLCDEPDKLYYTTRGSDGRLQSFIHNVKEKSLEISSRDTARAQVVVMDGEVYIIRNLYTTANYTKFGTLIVRLNTNKLFEGIDQSGNSNISFFINNTDSLVTCSEVLSLEEKNDIISKADTMFTFRNDRTIHSISSSHFTGVFYQYKFNDYYIGTILVTDKSILYSELKTLYQIMAFVLLIMIPIFIYMLYFIAHHITAPMSRMIRASKEIEKGNIGTQIEGEAMPNAEFEYLLESFNKMSSKVKSLFDYAYIEKLARKDAKIIALQSQINPHFLNNTFEMMNWQARMAGDTTVSKMIEALSTLLDFSMNRSNRKFISLAEELRSVDAYFYIISMRFGQRLQIEKDIDADLMQVQVPQLILQPILENAVLHGVEKVKQGRIKLIIKKDDSTVTLQVINSGKGMTEEELKRIDEILNKQINLIKEEKGKHVSLGIRNVNERIKLLYGNQYGLTITAGEDGDTVSTIILPCEVDDKTEEEKMLKSMLDMSRLNEI